MSKTEDILAAKGIKTEQRTRCEVYSRVMGYHRPVHTWNIGKRQEQADRLHFSESLAAK